MEKKSYVSIETWSIKTFAVGLMVPKSINARWQVEKLYEYTYMRVADECHKNVRRSFDANLLYHDFTF